MLAHDGGTWGGIVLMRAVTELVAQGLPTSRLASRLHLSPYTVHYAPRPASGARIGSDGWFAPGAALEGLGVDLGG